MATHEDVTHNKGTLVHLQDDTTTNTAVKQKGTPSGSAHVTLYDSSGTEQDLASYIVATPTLTSVGDEITSTTILAANGNRKYFRIHNNSGAILYLDETGGTASATNFTKLIAANGEYDPPGAITAGAITGIWASDAGGSALITEYA